MNMYPSLRSQILLQATEFLSEYSLTVKRLDRENVPCIACEYNFHSLVGFLLSQARARDDARAKALEDMGRMNPGAIVQTIVAGQTHAEGEGQQWPDCFYEGGG